MLQRRIERASNFDLQQASRALRGLYEVDGDPGGDKLTKFSDIPIGQTDTAVGASLVDAGGLRGAMYSKARLISRSIPSRQDHWDQTEGSIPLSACMLALGFERSMTIRPAV